MKRKVFVVFYLVNVVSTMLFPLFTLPARIAVQFSTNGLPVSWAPKVGFILVLFIVELLVFLAFIYAPGVISRSKKLPNSDYWQKAENAKNLKSNVSELISEMGTSTFLLIMIVALWIYGANMKDPVRVDFREVLLLPVFYAVYFILWSLRCVKSCRLPEKQN